MSLQIFVPVSAIFVKKFNELKNKICTVTIIHIININRILVVIFMVLEKSLFVLFILNESNVEQTISKMLVKP
jgi:hypothetical protein